MVRRLDALLVGLGGLVAIVGYIRNEMTADDETGADIGAGFLITIGLLAVVIGVIRLALWAYSRRRG